MERGAATGLKYNSDEETVDPRDSLQKPPLCTRMAQYSRLLQLIECISLYQSDADEVVVYSQQGIAHVSSNADLPQKKRGAAVAAAVTTDVPAAPPA